MNFTRKAVVAGPSLSGGGGGGVVGRGGGRAVRSALSLYLDPPTGEVTLEDFEVTALDRLRVLKGIEFARARGKKGADLKKAIDNLLQKYLQVRHTDPESMRKDAVSHHILRLAYAASNEKRQWFIAQEATLFRHRFEKESPEQVSHFMQTSGLDYKPISDAERSSIERELRTVWEVTGAGKDQATGEVTPFEATKFFKVSFRAALDLVGKRRVFVKAGYAYVPRDKLISIIMARFRAQLAFCLDAAYKALPAVLQDERLAPLLGNMSRAYVGPDFGKVKNVDEITPSMVEPLSHRSFPLCMANLQAKLKETHHLRHGGRMQYGLYLKGIGLNLENALQFWQGEFTKSMSAEEFVKRYAYNIRHNYGKEGRRTDYTPYSCQKIIMGSRPGPGDHHGCPYAHWDQSQLRATLARMSLASTAVDDIMESVKSHNYQVACRKHFEVTHPGGDSDMVGNHPNAWFSASAEYYKAKEAAAAKAGAATGDAGAVGSTAAVGGAGAAAAAGFEAPTEA